MSLRIHRWENRDSTTRKACWIELVGQNWPPDKDIVSYVSSHNFGSFVGKEQIVDKKRIKYVIVYID